MGVHTCHTSTLGGRLWQEDQQFKPCVGKFARRRVKIKKRAEDIAHGESLGLNPQDQDQKKANATHSSSYSAHPTMLSSPRPRSTRDTAGEVQLLTLNPRQPRWAASQPLGCGRTRSRAGRGGGRARAHVARAAPSSLCAGAACRDSRSRRGSFRRLLCVAERTKWPIFPSPS